MQRGNLEFLGRRRVERRVVVQEQGEWFGRGGEWRGERGSEMRTAGFLDTSPPLPCRRRRGAERWHGPVHYAWHKSGRVDDEGL